MEFSSSLGKPSKTYKEASLPSEEPSKELSEAAPVVLKAGHARVRVELADESIKAASVQTLKVKQSGIIDSDNEGDGDVKKAEG